MQPEERDAAYLWDMHNAALESLSLLDGIPLDDFIADLRLTRAIERTLEILGEAARRVSPECRAAHAGIPWKDIIGQRNVLAHDYGQIDHELLYQTVRQDLPALAHQLEALLPPLSP